MITQILLNGVIAGAIWTLVALGLSLIYNNTRFLNFAHGAVFTAGAYLTFLFKVWIGLSLLTSILLSIFFSMLTQVAT